MEIRHEVLDENEKFPTKGKVPTEVFKGGPALLKKAMGIAADHLRGWKTEGICVSTAGMVDVEKGEVFYVAPLTPEYAGTKFRANMEVEFELPCEVENDMNCTGLAKTVSEAAVGAQSTLCLTAGTGVGGCIVIGGGVYHGWSGGAYKVGYMYMNGGDFQTLGATSTLVRWVMAAKGEPETQWNGCRIFQSAGEGDSICVEATDQVCDYLGEGTSNIRYALDPQIVAPEGGITAQEEYLRLRLEKVLARYLVSSIHEKIELVFVRHQNDARIREAYYHLLGRQGKVRS